MAETEIRFVKHQKYIKSLCEHCETIPFLNDVHVNCCQHAVIYDGQTDSNYITQWMYVKD